MIIMSRKNVSLIFAGITLISSSFYFVGCSRWSAAYNMGISKKYFENRFLTPETDDYIRFLNLSKEAYPALAGYCHDHGNPSVILPDYSPIAQFVWEKDNITVSITYLDAIDIHHEIPPKVLEFRAKEKTK